MSSPKVSAVVLSYNQENWIEQCLHSIVKQDYMNLEIVLADDASSDSTVQKAEIFLRQSGRPFEIIRQPINRGITKNSNSAIRSCSGDFIAFCGADDLWDTSKISFQVAAMQDYDECSFSAHGCKIISSSGNELSAPLIPCDNPSLASVRDVISNKYPFYGSTTMIRKPENLVMFDERIRHASDLIYYTVLVDEYGPALVLPDVRASYRKNPSSVTNSKRSQILEDGLIGLAILQARFPEHNDLLIQRYKRLMLSYADYARKSGRPENSRNISRAMLPDASSLRFLWQAVRPL